ncbi:DUF551 domain-containing protein [Geobacter pelophilus]|uniref:DUF551 domain-containing protein n=1 Tax=Geoanaerobacter pelophilus TaxID=60036 RepID=A0AAW4LAR5_9BACT|nr:DUF551 domain-containing protein [Geoanaerobacter pelophilus]
MNATKGTAMKWIDANEKLPAESERVLLFTPYPIFGDDHACIGNKESITTCTARINRKKVTVFTHWMPLPPLPTKLTQ